MQEIITRLWLWLENNHPQFIETFNSAATNDDFKRLEAIIGLQLPQDFVELYSIFNGQKLTNLSLFSGDALMSIEDIIISYNQLKEVTPVIEDMVLKEYGTESKSEPEEGIRDDWWNKGWIPITSDGCGDCYCIDLNPTAEGQYGQIIRFLHDDAYRELIAVSIKDFLFEYVEDLENWKYEFSDSISWGGLMKIEDVE